MKLTHLNRHVARMKEYVLDKALPDTCFIVPSAGGLTVDDFGVQTPLPPTPRVWRSTIIIPCLFDVSRAMRNDRLDVQTTVSDEFIVLLPHDVVIDPNDYIVHRNIYFEIKKLKNMSEWDMMIEATVAASSIHTENITESLWGSAVWDMIYTWE